MERRCNPGWRCPAQCPSPTAAPLSLCAVTAQGPQHPLEGDISEPAQGMCPLKRVFLREHHGRISFWSPFGLHHFCHPLATFLPCSEQEPDWITSRGAFHLELPQKPQPAKSTAQGPQASATDTGRAGPKAVPYPAPCGSTHVSMCCGVYSKGTETKTHSRPLLESSHAPDGAAAEPFGSALPSKEPSHHPRPIAVQGLKENLISHLTGAILGMNLTPGQGLHTLNHPPCCYLQYQSQKRLSHELPGAVQTHRTAAPMLSLEGNVPFKAQFQSEPREMFSKPPQDTATGLLQRPQSNTPP